MVNKNVFSIKNLTQYFQQSLIDSERMCPADKDVLPVLGKGKQTKPTDFYISLDCTAWLSGTINQDLAEKLFTSKQTKGKPPLKEIELLLFPRVDLYTVRGAWRTSRSREVLLPLSIFVRLQRNGTFLPGRNPPWIPREWLSPNACATQPFAEFSVVDEYLTDNPYQGVETWPDLQRYCVDLLAAATGYSAQIETKYVGDIAKALFSIPLHEEYSLTQQCLLQIEPPIVGAKKKIIGVLEALGEAEEYPNLYRRFCSGEDTELKANTDLQADSALAGQHIAQMTGEFPLSPKQRNALHHSFKQDSGEILAVNGPPGTGKTTLLRSLVANLWTQAALAEVEPPLIVAASNNNQAVTNILASFAKVDESGLAEPLRGRWLPRLESYGLYCCSKDIAKNTPHQYMLSDGKGNIKDFQNNEYVQEAEAYFLQKISIWCGDEVKDIDTAKTRLHEQLKKSVQETRLIIKKLEIFLSYEQEIIGHYSSLDLMQQVLRDKDTLCHELNNQHQTLNQQQENIYTLWDKRPFWIHLLFWLPSIRDQQRRKSARLLKSWYEDIDIDIYSDANIEKWFARQLKLAKKALNDTLAEKIQMEQLRDGYVDVQEFLEQWLAPHKPQGFSAKTLTGQVNEINDRVFRFQSFKLASHYWEAHWLLELKTVLADSDENEQSPITKPRRYRRHAKLTPCFVSTFYMIPAFFTAYRGEEIPLFDEIDLLIVDEAGQALPEVSVASFALAKKAVIVGDTDQIEPVWGIPEKIDLANLTLFDLYQSQQHYESFWKKSGLLASGGNVMRAGQRQCRYHQFPQLQRGLYLTEHRRCYDEIISYCNQLVYQDVLEPLRGTANKPVPWGSMSMIEVFSPSKSYAGSRGNEGEATCIAQWLNQNRQAILAYSRTTNPSWSQKTDKEVIKLSVGVVTPFNKQARLILTKLALHKLGDITVGTVHKLQGDERVLIIFSSVYGENDNAMGKFYDVGTNMLNVAVSRARDCFIVFGNPNIFGVGGIGSPSGLLRRQLTVLK
ncbi:MAG: AAA domain-containing protein [Methyloglobulus sp.]|nr:AAA family ATPase [Methyloglobulus sp.]